MDWEGHQSFETEGLGFCWQARLRLWSTVAGPSRPHEDHLVTGAMTSVTGLA